MGWESGKDSVLSILLNMSKNIPAPQQASISHIPGNFELLLEQKTITILKTMLILVRYYWLADIIKHPSKKHTN